MIKIKWEFLKSGGFRMVTFARETGRRKGSNELFTNAFNAGSLISWGPRLREASL